MAEEKATGEKEEKEKTEKGKSGPLQLSKGDNSVAFEKNVHRMNQTLCYGHGKMCQEYFNFELPSSIIEKRRKTFVACCVPVS